MKLYLVHCGFYDHELFGGVYESHINFFVVAEDFEAAKLKAKLNPEYKNRKMHVDGLQEIQTVGGFDVVLKPNKKLEGQDLVVSSRHRELAPTKSSVI